MPEFIKSYLYCHQSHGFALLVSIVFPVCNIYSLVKLKKKKTCIRQLSFTNCLVIGTYLSVQMQLFLVSVFKKYIKNEIQGGEIDFNCTYNLVV